MTIEGLLPPLVFNVFKPAGVGSFDVVRHFKRNLPGGFGKIGHFGTLDPFACGVLMVGIGGAARLNDLVHAELPKTYLAVGKLGIQTDSGDHEGKILQEDSSPYLRETIGAFDQGFIQNLFQEKFLGEYWQAPPAFSAAKYEGKPLHVWAREGVEIKKEKVRRFVHKIEVVRWHCPYLSVRVTVSSGTYVRTLFAEMAGALGTLGHLIALQRESVGHVHWREALQRKNWPTREMSFEQIIRMGRSPESVLPYLRVPVAEESLKAFLNGVALPAEAGKEGEKAWMLNRSNDLLGLSQREQGKWKVLINFAASQAAE